MGHFAYLFTETNLLITIFCYHFRKFKHSVGVCANLQFMAHKFLLYRRFHGDVIRRVTWASAPLVGKRFLAGGLRVYFCLDSCLVYINFAHTQDHDYVLYLCGGTSGVGWTACFSLLSSKKMENEEKLWLNAFSCKQCQWGGRRFNNNIY